MSLSSFRYFLKVAKLGSIREASEVLYVAPSAISRQISKLEAQFGSELLEPHGRGIRLTAAGQALAVQAAKMIEALEQAQSDIDDLVGVRRGHIRTWSVEGSVSELVTKAISGFTQKYPMVTHEVIVASSDRILQALADGDADLGIVFHPPKISELRVLASGAHTLYAVAAPSHPACQIDKLAMATLEAYPLALPDTTFGLRHLLDAAARAAGLSLVPLLTTNSVEALRAFARLGTGLTVLPAFAVEDDVRRGMLRMLPLTDMTPRAARTAILTQRNRNIPIAADAFVGYLVGVLRDADRGSARAGAMPVAKAAGAAAQRLAGTRSFQLLRSRR